MKYHKLFYHPVLWQLVRFVITGSLATLTNFVILIVLVECCHWHPMNANVIAFTIAFFVSFFGHRFWTFASKRKLKSALPAFFVTAVTLFLLNQSLFYFFLSKLHFHYVFALSCVLITTCLCNFVVSRRWVFRATGTSSDTTSPSHNHQQYV